MTPLDFYKAVLPSSGWYCVAELTTRRKEHRYFDDIEDMAAAAAEFIEKEYDVYFAVSSFKEPGSREAANAQSCRSLFVDIDCGPAKAYASKVQAAEALAQLCASWGFDAPWVVDSGYGLHAYWPFDEDVPVHKAAALGSAFKRAVANSAGAVQGGTENSGGPEALRIDANVTGDTARILRAPGSFNWKHRTKPELGQKPRAVVIRGVGTPRPFSFYESFFEERLPAEPAPPRVSSMFDALGPNDPNAPKSAIHSLSLNNSEHKFLDLVRLSVDSGGCGQLRFYLENAQSDGMEPLWRGLLSLVKCCTDAEKAAARLSSLHPYSEQRTAAKLSEIKGPYACHKFNGLNPGVCGSCQHFGKIANPLALIRKTRLDVAPKELPVEVTGALPKPATPAAPAATAPTNPPAAPPTGTSLTIVRPPAPRGYAYGAEGGVYQIPEEGAPRLLVPFDLFLVDILKDGGKHLVHFTMRKGTTFTNITLPQKLIVSRDETLKALSEQNVVAAFGRDIDLHKYIRACVEFASHNKVPVEVPASCGWTENGDFVFDGRVFCQDGSEKTFPMPGLENIFKSSRPSGSLDGWREIVRMLIRNKEHEVLAMSLVGFGAPLMRFTGLYGMTFHLGSTESGTGKTLAIELAASVWGDPVRSRTTVDTSSIATLNRLGLLGSLPLCTDEITAKNRNDFEWLPGFLFSVTEGHGKDRMEAGANKERINTTFWQSLVLLSSNTHVMDYLTGARKHSSEGETRRLLELTLNKQMQLSTDDISYVKQLKKNYGYAGEQYARWLVANPEIAEKVVRETYAALYTDFGATNDERFWMAGIAAIVAGGVLAGSKYAGIQDYPMQGILHVLKGMVIKARAQVKEATRTADDILNAFIRQYYGKFVVVRKLAASGVMTAFGNGTAIDETITRSEVCGRVEHLRSGITDFFIEESLLKAFCASMSFGYSDFKEKIAVNSMVRFSNKNMLMNTKGPVMNVKAIQISKRTDEVEDILPVDGD